MSEYNWTAWGENNDGDTHEIWAHPNNVRDYSVTDASDKDLLAFAGISEIGINFIIERDCDGRAYIYRTNGDAVAVVESERTTSCEVCGYEIPHDDDCDHCAECDFCTTCGQEVDDGEGYDGRCGNCADASEATNASE